MRPRTRVRSASRRSNSELRLRRIRHSTARVSISATQVPGSSSGLSSAANLRLVGSARYNREALEHQQPEIPDGYPADFGCGHRRPDQPASPWSSFSFSSLALPG